MIAPALVRRYAKGTDSDATDALIVAQHVSSLTAAGTGAKRPNSHGMNAEKAAGGHLVAFRKAQKAHDPEDCERWEETAEAGALSVHGLGLPGSTAVHLTQDPITESEASPALGRTSTGMGLSDAAGVRRLTPMECERLMGWPDWWTAPPGVRAPDSRRYAACGDGVVAPVARWIGERIRAEHEA